MGVYEMKFGDFIRDKREELGFTLREFCQTFGHDPSNWSKIERGKLPPSDQPQILEMWAEQLNIKKGSETWQIFSDLAYQQRGEIPPDISGTADIAEILHLFFQALRSEAPSEEDLSKLLELIRKRKS
jgi:transcriptional regulator with XRE-family HTH domain